MSPLSNTSNAPLTPEQKTDLDRILQGLNPGQLAWLGGYLTALGTGTTPQAAVPAAAAGAPAITILYGSQTGNGEGVAELAAEQARGRGLNAKLVAMADYKPAQLKSEKNLLVVVSTHGEGDPPDMAEELHEFIYSKRAPKLADTRFSVLALGDTSYEFFCKTGADFDQRLEELGGKRLYPRVDCDLDYDQDAENWIQGALDTLAEELGSAAVAPPSTAAPAAVGSVYNRKNPFPAEILEMINLNGRGSAKETYHVELSLEGSGLTYEPGDALGVYPNNDPRIVDEVIAISKLSGTESVEIEGAELSLRDALLSRLEVTVLTKPLVAKYAMLGANQLNELLDDDHKAEFREYIEGRDLRDLLEEHPLQSLAAQDLADILRKLPPRLYSIASNLAAHPDEVHLTVGVVRFHSHGRDRAGVCSSYLAERTDDDSRVMVYVDTNKNFKLPTDPDTPVIMVGPGTGIAPFRAFVEEREETGAKGANWLFFGDQHCTTDFLYQTDWQAFMKKGSLHRMDVAFSRDQDYKIYVQNRMLERSQDLYRWLEEGAHFYVCGDEGAMAHDVHSALIKILQKEGGLKEEQAVDYMKKIQKEKRYQRDVY
jgi:sulfite reductase (NADPH) flavoprotein alpha-component